MDTFDNGEQVNISGTVVQTYADGSVGVRLNDSQWVLTASGNITKMPTSPEAQLEPSGTEEKKSRATKKERG